MKGRAAWSQIPNDGEEQVLGGEGCRGRGHGRSGVWGGTSLEGGTKGPKILGHCPHPKAVCYEQLPMEGPGDSAGAGGAQPHLGQHGLPACLLFLHPHPHQHPLQHPPSTAVPPSNSPTPAGYWLNGATSAQALAWSGLTGESLSPCAQPQASPSPGRDTTSDSACSRDLDRGRAPGPGWAEWRCPQLHSPLCPQMETLAGAVPTVDTRG